MSQRTLQSLFYEVKMHVPFRRKKKSSDYYDVGGSKEEEGYDLTDPDDLAVMTLSDLSQVYGPKETDQFLTYESPYVIRVNLNKDKIWAHDGSMIAYEGKITWNKETVFSGGFVKGLRKKAKRTVLRDQEERASLVKWSGKGMLFLGDGGKLVHVLKLDSDRITINAPSLVAFQPTLKYSQPEPTLKGIAKGLTHIGKRRVSDLIAIKFAGIGNICLSSTGRPIVFDVRKKQIVCVDHRSIVAWSSDLSLKEVDDGRRIEFKGIGFVMVQGHPYEDDDDNEVEESNDHGVVKSMAVHATTAAVGSATTVAATTAANTTTAVAATAVSSIRSSDSSSSGSKKLPPTPQPKPQQQQQQQPVMMMSPQPTHPPMMVAPQPTHQPMMVAPQPTHQPMVYMAPNGQMMYYYPTTPTIPKEQ